MFERGKTYKREQISKTLGGRVQNFLPNVDGRVTYGAFSRDLNPQAPTVILPGTGHKIERSARLFAEQEEAVPVFLKKRANEWAYMGQYRCVELSEDPELIAAHAAKTGRDDITMVLRLERQRTTPGQS